VPTTPLLLWLARLWGLRFEREEPVEREEPLLEREAVLRPRVEADDFEREDPLALVFEPEAFDELLLLCPLREVDLLLAILAPPSIENIRFLLARGTHLRDQ
jgi:hypothetical protein